MKLENFNGRSYQTNVIMFGAKKKTTSEDPGAAQGAKTTTTKKKTPMVSAEEATAQQGVNNKAVLNISTPKTPEIPKIDERERKEIMEELFNDLEANIKASQTQRGNLYFDNCLDKIKETAKKMVVFGTDEDALKLYDYIENSPQSINKYPESIETINQTLNLYAEKIGDKKGVGAFKEMLADDLGKKISKQLGEVKYFISPYNKEENIKLLDKILKVNHPKNINHLKTVDGKLYIYWSWFKNDTGDLGKLYEKFKEVINKLELNHSLKKIK